MNSFGIAFLDDDVTLYKVKSSTLITMHVVINFASCSKT